MALQERIYVGGMFVTKSESVQEGEIINALLEELQLEVTSYQALENPSHKTQIPVRPGILDSAAHRT